MRRLAVAAIVALGAPLVFIAGAQACSCAQMVPAEALRRADAAIVGELIEVVPRARLRADYRYRVQRVYKPGEGIRPGSTISVRSASQSAACGLPGRAGHSYGLLLSASPVVYRRDTKPGAGGGGRWTGGLCGVVAPRKLRSAARHSPREARASAGVGPVSSCAS